MDIRDQSLANEIYQKIKYDILNIVIKDGEFLTLAELASKYGVSKTPIRDALNALENEGYLKSLPRKGYLVVPITQNDMREYFQMRIILEKSAASLAVRFAQQSELDDIMKLAMQFPKHNPEGDFAEFSRLNNIFHMSIIRAAHNTLMADICAGIMENLSRILMADSRQLDMSHEKEEHIAIAKALLDRDGVLVESLIIGHIIELQARAYRKQEGRFDERNIWRIS